ncbi:SAF domain-containing protein [Jatrophihabitans endophyticus]|uniref:SAF domain-containing protein n=1 Tax=Jatrophihabitans endophyticus TaxID=1206085 RepID=A0A1M5EX42_9ACTN|nr:SAF domain-containing protein [Jatrophihabitans endophyticus]SHF83804.1 SAF domain-containing protein [Jatrophihabitans endophyticus]
MAEPSPAPRRIGAPRWLDLRLVLGVVLVLASVALGATVVSRAGDTTPSVTARHDLAAGTTLRAQDLEVSQVRLPDDGSARYLDDVDDAVGRTLARPVSRGELLPAAAVTATPARTTLTVTLAAGAAPDLRAGQRIELWLSTPACAFVVLLPDVTVQSVRAGEAGSLADAGTGQDVVIAVAPALAPRVVAAQSIEDAHLRAGVLVGGRPAATRAPVPSGSGGATMPADLAACTSSTAGR